MKKSSLLSFHSSEKPQDDRSSAYLEDAEELQCMFNQFELGEIFKAMGSSYTADELSRVMEDIDADHDGFINIEEFGRLCRFFDRF